METTCMVWHLSVTFIVFGINIRSRADTSEASCNTTILITGRLTTSISRHTIIHTSAYARLGLLDINAKCVTKAKC